LKDIRTLQVGFKSVTGRYTASMDTLQMFYRDGKMDVVMQVGSQDDSIAVANTARIKKKNPKIKPEQLLELYRGGENIVFSITTKIPVKDTLCNRPDFCIDSIAFIPCCGEKVRMDAIVKTVSGVKVPLFEAKIPYGEKRIVAEARKTTDKKGNPILEAEKYVIDEYLLIGLDHQLVVNLCTELIDTDRYPGLMVGSIDNPNNNAGNWE
ncbi:MAG: hypothetical protein HUJ91_07130, partial [Bacteroidales bacterium]|nr:hypothetical protein [Bacteroidales bacterium]